MLPFPGSVVKSLSSCLNLDDEDRFYESVKQVMEKHSRDDLGRSYKKDLTKVCEEIQELKFEKQYPIIILYGNFLSTDGKKTDRPKYLTTDEHVLRIVV